MQQRLGCVVTHASPWRTQEEAALAELAVKKKAAEEEVRAAQEAREEARESKRRWQLQRDELQAEVGTKCSGAVSFVECRFWYLFSGAMMDRRGAHLWGVMLLTNSRGVPVGRRYACDEYFFS